MGNLWGPYIRFCILTGQRCRSDILHMQWSWIDFERCRYEIPNPKNGRPHIVHLSEPAIKELLNLQTLQADNPSPFIFTTTGRRAASGVRRQQSETKIRQLHPRNLGQGWATAVLRALGITRSASITSDGTCRGWL